MAVQSRFDSHALIDNRQIRIFLSSTFSDMQAERTALLRTFDTLRLKANRRNVDLSVLDLRWGVTDDEARSGKVISVCLNEIEHSHPFFIGLLGSRYGYAPEMTELERNPDLLERYPWLADDIADGRSITEMEMLYGVLRNEAEIDAAFYIKQTDTPDDDPRQTALKAKIRGQQHYPVADYASIDDLCTLVEAEVTAILDRHFPETEVTPLDRERTAQRAYINSRHAHFVGREEELRALDDYARSDRRHLVVTGDSGMGKSALLARWCRMNEDSDDFNLVYHFMGNSFSGNNYESVLRHLCDEIYDLYQIEKESERQEKPEDEAQRLVSELRQREKSLVVVIDGINQLLAPKDEKLLLWLPAANDKVKYLFTTQRDDETMRTFERRGFEVLDLQPLTDAQRRQFAVGYLENVGKHLNDAQWQRILSDPENRNTLVLRTFLDELICFGSHEQLDARIDSYLGTGTIPEFFDRVLQRMEHDYDNGQQLVRHALTLIAVSERGLSEEELLTITGFRQMDWHLFYCAFFNHLVVRDGLITFSHQYVAAAVAHRYNTADEASMASYRREIVAYFDQQTTSNRRTSELAHQYYHLEDWNNLHDTLLNFGAFSYFNDTNKPLLAKYWRALLAEEKNNYSLEEYLILNPMEDELAMAASFNDIGYFVQEYFADYSVGLNYYSKTLEIREKVLGEGHTDTATTYNNIGALYYQQGKYEDALKYHFMALAIREKKFGEEHADTAVSYIEIGVVYKTLANYDKALEYDLKALKVCEKLHGKYHGDTATIYNNIGTVYETLDEKDKALDYYFKALEINEKVLGIKHPHTALFYNNIGCLNLQKGDCPKALEYHFKALSIQEELFGSEHPSIAETYGCIGLVFFNQSNYNKALDYYKKQLNIYENVFDVEHPSIAISFHKIGSVYFRMGNYNMALEYYFKALKNRERIFGKEHPSIANSYRGIGEVYTRQGEYSKALECFGKAIKILEKKYGPEHSDMAGLYIKIGEVYHYMDDYEKSREYCRKALSIDEKVLGFEHPNTAAAYSSIGTLYNYQGDYENALEYLFKALLIYEKVLGKEHPFTAITYSHIGSVYGGLGNKEKSLEYKFKSLSALINANGEEHPDTATAYSGIGSEYYENNEYDKALEYYLTALVIRKKVLGAEHPITAQTYNNIGVTYDEMGDYDKALEYYLKACEILEKVHDKLPDHAIYYDNAGYIFYSKGNYDKSLEYYLKAMEINEKEYGTEHLKTAMSYDHIGGVYNDSGDYEKALEYYLRTLEIRKKQLPSDDPNLAWSLNQVGFVLYKQEKYEESLDYFIKSLEIRENVLGRDHSDTASSYNNVGCVYRQLDNYDKAIELFNKALNIYEKKYGSNHPETIAMQKKIADLKDKMGQQ